jgi:trehalose 6-phosphate phosphatase
VQDDPLESLRADPGRAAILCDVDGTLAPITDDPSTAGVPEPTRELLRELARRYAMVACLTGRRALDAREIVGVGEISYAGNHGFEMLDAGAGEPVADPAVGGRSGRPREFIEGLDQERLAAAGLRLEDKGAIQAVHWRGTPDGTALPEVKAIAAAAQAADLVPRWGRKVLEIRPVAGIDKGSAARRMLRDAGVRAALFGGDDATDLDAFNALKWMERSDRLANAVCVGVTSPEQPEGLEEAADVLVDGPEGFAELLERLR